MHADDAQRRRADGEHLLRRGKQTEQLRWDQRKERAADAHDADRGRNGKPDSFFEALYWAFAMLTTVGYGDIYPVTRAGRLVSMVSSVFGTAVIAMPAGILTAGFMEEINKVRFKDERKLEQEVSELLDEIKQLRKEQAERGLEEKIEKIAAQVEQVQEHRDQDAVLLQDLSEDLKNALARGTINEIKEEAEQV